MNILQFGKKTYALRECGCAGKGAHKKTCQGSVAPAPMTQATTPPPVVAPVVTATPGNTGVNLAPATAPTINLMAQAQTPANVPLTEEQATQIFIDTDESNVWTPYNDGNELHYAPLYWEYSGQSKDGSVYYFNCQNGHNIAKGGLVYVTRNGGLGVSGRIFGGQPVAPGTILFTPVVAANRSNLA